MRGSIEEMMLLKVVLTCSNRSSYLVQHQDKCLLKILHHMLVQRWREVQGLESCGM